MIKNWIGIKICEFGMYVLNLGPKDPEDRANYRALIINKWKQFSEITPEDAEFMRSFNKKQSP